jgi:F-type H+-transporting ATPase subunit b
VARSAPAAADPARSASAEILRATQKEVTLQRGSFPGVWLVSAAIASLPASASAAEGLNLFPDPLKVAINVVVFLLLIYPTSRFLLRPLTRTLEEREKRTAGALTRMDSLLGEAAELRETLDARLEQARQQAQMQRAAVLQQAEEEERRELTEAREAAGRRLEEARSAISAEVEAARESLRAEADTLARELASKVLGRSV